MTSPPRRLPRPRSSANRPGNSRYADTATRGTPLARSARHRRVDRGLGGGAEGGDHVGPPAVAPLVRRLPAPQRRPWGRLTRPPRGPPPSPVARATPASARRRSSASTRAGPDRARRPAPRGTRQRAAPRGCRPCCGRPPQQQRDHDGGAGQRAGAPRPARALRGPGRPLGRPDRARGRRTAPSSSRGRDGRRRVRGCRGRPRAASGPAGSPQDRVQVHHRRR